VTSTRFDAVIFDFDGTLVASAPAKRQAFFTIFPEACAAAVEAVLRDDPDGSRHVVIPRMIASIRGQGIDLPDADYIARYGEESERAVAAAPELPGASNLLKRLSATTELHVCSNTPEETVRRHVATRGWQRYFASVEGWPTKKRDRIAAVMASHRRVAMVGDGISDEEAARANACAFFRIERAEDLRRIGQSLEALDV